jgi:hypothetical protein
MSRGTRAAIICWASASFAAGLLEQSPSAWAQAAALSPDQIAAIQLAVDTALANIDPALIGAARTQAVNQALSQVAANEITLDGAGAISPVISAAIAAGIPAPQAVPPVLPMAISMGVSTPAAINDIMAGSVAAGGSATQTAEAIIAVGIQSGTASNLTGSGLGQAAASLSITNTAAANAIAQVVSNQGTGGTAQAFSTAVFANGGSQQLVTQALQNPTATIGAIPGAANTTAAAAAATTTLTTVGVSTNLASGSTAQTISAVNTVVACTTPSCN